MSETKKTTVKSGRSARLGTGKTLGGVSRNKIVEHLSAADKKMAALIERVGPLTLESNDIQSSYQALAESIVYQQITGKAAQSICKKVFTTFETDIFPEPHIMLAAPMEKLRSCGLSSGKAMAIKDLAEKTLAGVVPTVEEMHQLEDEELAARLTSVRGIGPWTVHMLLIFRLARLDVMPATDYGIRKGFALTYYGKNKIKAGELPTPSEIHRQAERWRPYRSAASWYLWRATDLEKA
ncbi:MAG: DNA-3-methyladenine glycosylase 2 family protein [Cyanobacteria bacterium SZAS LIN-2]|nr:DNA-3-methyladenine glycosylase 2 family protein [Cyanobacteria bacterium SZAS LIN-3]MBS1995357.1 DNA-3-methyladenine glycosylase 2 family protein [Cyanobacteria bacterium SZAS LIN-2]